MPRTRCCRASRSSIPGFAIGAFGCRTRWPTTHPPACSSWVIAPSISMGLDLSTCGMVLEKNGVIECTGVGAAALGSPVNCVTWLANALGRFGIPLQAGEIILSGSLGALISVAAGDSLNLSIGGIGSAAIRFVHKGHKYPNAVVRHQNLRARTAPRDSGAGAPNGAEAHRHGAAVDVGGRLRSAVGAAKSAA